MNESGNFRQRFKDVNKNKKTKKGVHSAVKASTNYNARNKLGPYFLLLFWNGKLYTYCIYVIFGGYADPREGTCMQTANP